MKEIKLAIIGDVAWNHDITPTGQNISPGGAAYYSVVGASHFSENIGIVARVGNNFDLSLLKRRGIDIDGIRVIPGGKTCQFEVVQHSDGSRDFEAYRGVAGIVDTSIFPDRYFSSQFIHLSTQLPEHALTWLDIFTQHKGVSVDSFEFFVKQFPDLIRNMFQKANMIFTNESEWQVMQGFGDDFTGKPMIIKCGKDGAIYKHKDEILVIPAPKVEAVDFSGAGDILAGAFLTLRAQGVSVETALKDAVNLASYSVTKFGVEHILSMNQLLKPEKIGNSKTCLMTPLTKKILSDNLEAKQDEAKRHLSAIGEAAGRESDWHDNAAFEEANRLYDIASIETSKLTAKLKDSMTIVPRLETDFVGLGNTVQVRFDGEVKDETLTILGPDDAIVKQGWISYQSPLARNLMGKKAGDIVEYKVDNGITIKATVQAVLPGNF